MIERKQFTFYESFFSAISRIKDNSERAATYDAICAYALYGRLPDLDALPVASAIAFELIKPTLDSSRKKAKSGQLGGSKKPGERKAEGNRNQNASKPQANQSEEEVEGEGEKEIEIEGEKEVEDECLIPAGAPHNDPVVAAVISDYLNRINPMASPYSLQELSDFAVELGEDVCLRVFDIALDSKKTTWSYIRAILQDKKNNGVKCLADFEALEEKRNARKDGEKNGSSNSNRGKNPRVGNYVG